MGSRVRVPPRSPRKSRAFLELLLPSYQQLGSAWEATQAQIALNRGGAGPLEFPHDRFATSRRAWSPPVVVAQMESGARKISRNHRDVTKHKLGILKREIAFLEKMDARREARS